jgi:hypothetical protein
MLYGFKISVSRITETGKEKRQTEEYITDAITFGEVEVKAQQIIDDYNLDGSVTAIFISPIKEIQERNGSFGKTEENDFYKVTVVTTLLNDNGTEKELKYQTLVAASSVAEANKLSQEYIKQYADDMRIDGVVKTKIINFLK